MKGVQIAVVFLAINASTSAQSIWTNNSFGSTETIVGVSASGRDFTVGVGNAGQIVHLNESGIATIVPSATSKNLLDVFAVDADFAVASGQDVVLLWDGMTWGPLFAENTGDPVFYTPVWASSDKDYLLHQRLSSGGGLGGFHVVCPYVVSDPDSGGFCRLFSRPILTICGSSGDDIKALQTDGSILRFTERSLSNLDDPQDRPLFEQPPGVGLNLIAAFIPPELCAPGNDSPPLIYAINQSTNNEFYQFDGTQWLKTGDAGAGEVLTGITGLSDTLVVAIGRRPVTAKGPLANAGVAWAWDGTTWISEPLPPGTPGLADIIGLIDFQEVVFTNGFEGSAVGQKILPQAEILRAVGEGSNVASRPPIDPSTGEPIIQADLAIVKTLISPAGTELIGPGTQITFRNEVTNRSPTSAKRIRIRDRFLAAQLSLNSVTCMSSTQTDSSNPGMPSVTVIEVPDIPAMESQTCDVTFSIITGDSPISTGVFIENRAYVTSAVADINQSNNVDSCSIRGSFATVEC